MCFPIQTQRKALISILGRKRLDMGGYVGVLVLFGGGFVIQFFGDRDRSSQYVKIYRIEGAALSKQVFDGGSLDLTVFSKKDFADGGSVDLTARWINFVKGKAFIVVRSSDLNLRTTSWTR